MSLKIFALGGLEEKGKSSYIVETENDIVIIDMGSKKYENLSLGVDSVINDISYLVEKKDKVRALIISHSHLDSIGGIDYLLEEIPVPVYGSKYTIEFLKGYSKYKDLRVFKDDNFLKLGELKIETFNLSHSVFGHLGFVIAKENDAIVFATDYNFNQSSKFSTRTDLEKIVKLKNKYNIKVLLTESQSAHNHGVASGDLSFMPAFKRITENMQGKLFISLYSHNISGMTNIINVAEEYKKKVVIIGKELLTYVNVSKKLGYIDHISDMFIKTKDISKYDDNQIMVVVSGDFLEPFLMLEKLSNPNHPITTITQNDTVLIASEAHDEVEGEVQKILDRVSRTHCKIKHLKVDVSPHAHEEDIKMMINLFDPKFIVPINGEYRKFKKVEEIARTLGYSSDSVKIISNGDVLEYKDEHLTLVDTIHVGTKLVNEKAKESINPMLLYDRETLSEEGYVLITMIVGKSSQRLIQAPEIISGGLMAFDDDKALVENCTNIVSKGLENGIDSSSIIKVKNKIKRLLNTKIGKSPIILTIKVEVK